eukprot:3284506-Amphidinium_carterae.1
MVIGREHKDPRDQHRPPKKINKQVKQLQTDLAASQQQTSELRAKNMRLPQQLEQLQTTNYYCLQSIQANAKN